MPSIGTYTKILHGVLATNHILTQRNDPSVATDKCECCASQDLETNNHTLGTCTHRDLKKMRAQMIQKLHNTIDNTLRHGKEKMSINPIVTKALCCMWSEKTVQQLASRQNHRTTQTKHGTCLEIGLVEGRAGVKRKRTKGRGIWNHKAAKDRG